MIESLKSLFSSNVEAETEQAMTPELAAASLMVEAALADGVFADVEHDKIALILREGFKLDEAAANATLKAAQEQVENAVDHHRFTKVVKKMTLAQRKIVMTHLWMIVLADGENDAHEDALLRRLAPLLALSDHERAETRQHAVRLANAD
jgi:uncharacterized tellurite resistance protein B-like protein